MFRRKRKYLVHAVHPKGHHTWHSHIHGKVTEEVIREWRAFSEKETGGDSIITGFYQIK